MDIRERAIETIKNADTGKIGDSILHKAEILAWEAGLGPVINGLPNAFGQQAVLYFPGRSQKFTFPCCEHNGKILLALNDAELEQINEYLLQSPGIEIWLKSGWYAGTVRMLTPEQKDSVTETITDDEFFGNAGELLTKKSLRDLHLLEVTRTAPCTGSSGPGSKSWVWAAAAGLLLLSPKKRK